MKKKGRKEEKNMHKVSEHSVGRFDRMGTNSTTLRKNKERKKVLISTFFSYPKHNTAFENKFLITQELDARHHSHDAAPLRHDRHNKTTLYPLG